MLSKFWPAIGLGLLGLLGGCGPGDATPRYDISGTVTYAGQPVPVGTILFLPDGAKGNRGPSGFAEIQDGKYDTAREGEGVVGGPHVVQIAGFDGHGKSEASPDGNLLFSEYTATIELPKEITTYDVDVPAARKGRPR